LNFSAEKVSWKEFHKSFFPFIQVEFGEIVVDNMATTPSTKHASFQKVELVISHLIIGH